MRVDWAADWRKLANCSGLPIEVFYPDDDADPDDYAAAKWQCGRCPVRVDCLTDAIAGPVWEEWGIWGGANETSRRTLRHAWRNRRHDRPTPYDPDCPWSVAVAEHFDTLDRTLAADLDDFLDSVAAERITTPTLPRWLDTLDVRPHLTLIGATTPAPPPDGSCGRCGSVMRPQGARTALDRNGPGAVCGKPGTYAKGCRCIPCHDAHMARTAAAAPQLERLFGSPA